MKCVNVARVRGESKSVNTALRPSAIDVRSMMHNYLSGWM